MSKQYHDPVTGDELTRLEYYTRQVQVLVRTPWFILAFNVITLVAMILGHGDVWNYFASWLAIMVEWLVGTYMFGQTGRDATYIRRIANLEEMMEQQLEHLEAIPGYLYSNTGCLIKAGEVLAFQSTTGS